MYDKNYVYIQSVIVILSNLNRVRELKMEKIFQQCCRQIQYIFIVIINKTKTYLKLIKCKLTKMLSRLKVNPTRGPSFFLVNRAENQKLSQTAANDSRAAVWLSFWFSTRFTKKNLVSLVGFTFSLTFYNVMGVNDGIPSRLSMSFF